MADAPPWLTRSEDLTALLAAAESASAVVVTQPFHRGPALSLGRVLSGVLKGDTRSFTAVVGYFGHSNDGSEPAEDEPAAIILREGEEWFANSRSSPPTFRLMFGKLAYRARVAQMALRTWYWLCRWRACPGDDGAPFFGSLSAALAEARADTRQSRTPFKELTLALLRPLAAGGPLPAISVLHGPNRSAPGYPDGRVATAKDTALFREWREVLLGQVAEFEEDNQGEAGRAVQAVAALLLYLVTHEADVRVARTEGLDRTFHAKLYVVERGGDHATTVAIAGSGNWTRPALAVGEAFGSNTEVATLHTLGRHAWEDAAGADVGSRLVATTRALFDRGATLGRWHAIVDARIPSAEEAWQWTRLEDDVFPASTPATAQDEDRRAEIASMLRHMLGRTLGIPEGDRAEQLRLPGEVGAAGEQLFAGQKPEEYQLDGALRLLTILQQPAPLAPDSAEKNYQSRGAFLTDEAGLGKTLIAQLVAYELVVRKLQARYDANDDRPVLVAYIAPKQLAGDDASGVPDAPDEPEDSRGWQRHRRAVDAEVERRLAPWLTDRGVADAAAWLRQRLKSAVVSVSALSRRTRLPDGNVRPEVLVSLSHVARSEIVVIDESHHLRNATSRKARIVRWLLTLPVPGEAWPLKLGDAWVGETSERYRRKVLCLTATPFNNSLSDLVSQIGHFATTQDWSGAGAAGRARQERLRLAGEPDLRDQLRAWTAASAPDRLDQVLASMLRVLDSVPGAEESDVTAFFDSTRALDMDPRQREKAAAGLVKEQRIRDTGPTFGWGDGYADAVSIFPPIQQYLDPSKQVAGTPPVDPQEAINRLDTLLAGVFVQRSRTRVLQALDPASRRRLFRNPQRPRVPLPLNQWTTESRGEVEFEARVLQQLFTMLQQVQDVGLTGATAPKDALRLQGYRMKAWSEMEGDGGTIGDNAAARNQFGFILIGLVKRLQSSPYAFLRSLLSGVFRSSLRWVAVVEQLLAGRLESEAPIRAVLARAGRASEGTRTLLSGLQPASRQALSGMLGGEWEGSDPSAIGRLLGGGSLRGPAGLTLEAKQQRALRNRVAEAALTEPRPPWFTGLLADLEAGSEGLMLSDARLCLCWAFGEPERLQDGRRLYSDIFPRREVLAAMGGGTTLGAVREALRAAPLWRGSDFDDWSYWLDARLKADSRARNAVAWLTIQAVARAEVAESADPGDELRQRLPGGAKTLMFSEYTDTLDYVACLLQVAGNLAASWDGRGEAPGFVAKLRTAMRDVANLLTAEAERVSRSPAPNADVQPTEFRSPVDLEWLTRALGTEGAPLRLTRALCLLREDAGMCTGGARQWLGYSDALPPAALLRRAEAAVSGVELDAPDDDAPVVEDDATLDAFSPYYQIAPADSLDGGAKQASARMALLGAAQRPVHILLATQVLSEGVNLQECGVVVHYDLPWNPTTLIQRNGRVDRRVDARYEQDLRRIEMLGKLGGGSSRFPAFVAPEQVFHLTIVPPEPRLAGADTASKQANRYSGAVRRTLLDKLGSIRKLFGLSQWPIVLDAEEARRVLSGELDFETQGMGRREDLFRQWNELRRMVARAEPEQLAALPAAGTVLVRLNDSGASAARTALAHTVPAGGWMDPAIAAVWTWAPDGALTPVRSGIEWRGRRAITTWLLPDALRVLAWAPWTKDFGAAKRIQPRWTRFDVEAERASDDVGVYAKTEVPSLPGAEPGRGPVASPTSMSEEWLRHFIELFLKSQPDVEFTWRDGFALPSSVGVPDALLAIGRRLPGLPTDREPANQEGKKLPKGFAAATSPVSGWNLMIVVDPQHLPEAS